MAQVANLIANKTAAFLNAPAGLNAALVEVARAGGVDLGPVPPRQILLQNISPEIAERSSISKYPSIHVFCERVTNTLREKFRMFSGEAGMVVEVRVSSDRVEHTERDLQLYTEAVTLVLEQARGDWGGGAFYTGGYEISYGPVKHGGRNFLQSARISFRVDVSRN